MLCVLSCYRVTRFCPARAAARTVWTMMGGRHVEETAEKSGPPRAGDHGEPGEAATGDD